MADRIPILFVAGTGRTGSTLVGNLLATTPGVLSIGEVRHIWTRGVVENWACGCGQRFADCPFWTAVLREAFGGAQHLDLPSLLASERRLLRFRAGRRVLRSVRRPTRLQQEFAYYLATLERLYGVIAAVSGAEAIVDTSKTPSYAALLSLLDVADLRILHLIRDPRAAAYSWLNPKPSPDRRGAGEMDRINPAKSALLWSWWNAIAEGLAAARPEVPVTRVRYEALSRDPETTLRTIRRQLLPELAEKSMAVTGHIGRLPISHTLSGNPDRMQSGSVEIRLDERWRKGLALRHQVQVLAIAGPGMLRYGYWRSQG
ncbi:MAG: sulfotransferase [Acidimicrobiia bacterium]